MPKPQVYYRMNKDTGAMQACEFHTAMVRTTRLGRDLTAQQIHDALEYWNDDPRFSYSLTNPLLMESKLDRYVLEPWCIHDNTEDTIYLIRATDYFKIPDGTALTSISGDVRIKGLDEIDLDARGGLLAFGIRKYQLDALCEPI